MADLRPGGTLPRTRGRESPTAWPAALRYRPIAARPSRPPSRPAQPARRSPFGAGPAPPARVGLPRRRSPPRSAAYADPGAPEFRYHRRTRHEGRIVTASSSAPLRWRSSPRAGHDRRAPAALPGRFARCRDRTDRLDREWRHPARLPTRARRRSGNNGRQSRGRPGLRRQSPRCPACDPGASTAPPPRADPSASAASGSSAWRDRA